MTKAPLFMFGWAKPVPVNFGNLRNPKRDMLWVAGAGTVRQFRDGDRLGVPVQGRVARERVRRATALLKWPMRAYRST